MHPSSAYLSWVFKDWHPGFRTGRLFAPEHLLLHDASLRSLFVNFFFSKEPPYTTSRPHHPTVVLGLVVGSVSRWHSQRLPELTYV